jgi:integral membrane protein
MIKLFRIVGSLEAISFLLLLGVGVPLKYLAGMPAATKGLGYVHGVLFILFCICLAAVVRQYSISLKVGLLGFVAAIVPLGPCFYHPYLKKHLDQKSSE